MQTNIGSRVIALINDQQLLRRGYRDSSNVLHLDWRANAAEQIEALIVDFITESANLERLHAAERLRAEEVPAQTDRT